MATSGVWLSPNARRMAAAMLYAITTRVPPTIVARYSAAASMMSVGVPSASSAGRAASTPATVMAAPVAKHSQPDMASAVFRRRQSRSPK